MVPRAIHHKVREDNYMLLPHSKTYISMVTTIDTLYIYGHNHRHITYLWSQPNFLQLHQTTKYEDKKKIRAAIRDLRKQKGKYNTSA